MKILIISHNPLTKQSNMGLTFQSLFARVQPEELCQLYVYPTVPDEARCHSFYRITDKEALKAVFSCRAPGGVIAASQIQPDQGVFENAQDEALYRSRKNKSALRRLGRDLIWQLSGWYSKDLRQWLEREQPDRIFVAPGVAKFLYDMALRISRDRNIPIVSYVCDEFYFIRRPDQLLDRLRLKLLQRKMEALMAHTSQLVTISQELKESYSRHFGVKATVVMTGAGEPVAESTRVAQQPDTIHYFGNIRCNRFVSLEEIGRELDRRNRETGSHCRLKIYTFEKDPTILDTFSGIDSIQVCAAVTGEAFRQVFSQAQLLLHTEAFDEASMDFVKNSISTKLADSLASGIPLLAYGPEGVASMQHLQRNGCALTAFSREALPRLLEQAFTDTAARQQAAQRGLEAAKVYHDPDQVAQKLRQILESVVSS